jgi:pimeloyl-ACP methyl ester carboxylesterase
VRAPALADRPLITQAQAGQTVGLFKVLANDSRLALRSGRAVHDPAVLTPELLHGYIAANLADRHRRAKTRRFLAGQLDPANQRATADALPGLRAFDHPTLIVWGRDDPTSDRNGPSCCAATSPAPCAWNCCPTPGTC